MSLTADQCRVTVIKPGGGKVVRNTYIGDAATTFKAGDLVRVTTSGSIQNAAGDTDTTGPCHGMVLEDHDTAAAATAYVDIFLFAKDTILKIQVYNGTATDAEPQDVDIGVAYEVRDGGSGKWSITTTSTKGYMLVVDKAGNSKWFETDEQIDADYGFVYVRISQAHLDAHGAAA